MKHDIKMQIAGRYKLVVVDKTTFEVKTDTGWVPNLITDIGMDAIDIGWSVTECYLGDGTTPPNPADTSLVNLMVTQSVNGDNVTYGDHNINYSFVSRIVDFVIPTIPSNFTINEMGIGGTQGLVSRVVLNTGVPITTNDQLTLVYEVRLLFSGIVGDSGFLSTGDGPNLKVQSSQNGPTGGLNILYTGVDSAIAIGSTVITTQFSSYPITAPDDLVVDPYIPGSFQRTAHFTLNYYYNRNYNGMMNDMFQLLFSSNYPTAVSYYPLSPFDVLTFDVTYSWARI